MRALSILFLMLLFVQSIAGSSYSYTAGHKKAYDLIISMRFEEASSLIEEIKRENPDDILVYHIENYIDFIGIFVSEDRDLFKERELMKAKRLEKLKEGDPNDPHFLFSQAEVHLQWAFTRVKFQEYLSAAHEVNKAIGMLERNLKKFPDFLPNKKSLSILHAVVGTLPDRYKGIVALVSNFSGTIEQGLSEIEEVLEHDEDGFFKIEAVAIKAMIMLHLQNKKEDAWNYLANSIVAERGDPMSTFLKASTAMNCGKNEEAISILENRLRSPRFFPFYYLDLMLGSAKLARLDRDANVYIQSYIKNFEGLDYYKDAYRKLAWHALAVKNDEKLYAFYMEECRLKGNANIDEDKSAFKDAKKGGLPNRQLLKARILFDGGYLKEAKQTLELVRDFPMTKDDEIELLYRNGRICQNLNESQDAILQFLNCLDLCSQSRLYYCCNSALQIGSIYEQKGDLKEAKKYFKLCLSLNPSEYRGSLHQKAKAGLNRIKSFEG